MRTITLLTMKNETKKTDILFLIKRLNKLIDQDLDARLATYGLTSQQGRILFFINRRFEIEHQEVHQNDIENEYHLSKSTVSGLVKRMEKKEIITIEKQHPYAILKPTDKAKEILCHLRTHKDETIERLLSGIDDRDQLFEQLLLMINNMEGGNENVEKY